jgi:Flp pilus assembly protein TadD
MSSRRTFLQTMRAMLAGLLVMAFAAQGLSTPVMQQEGGARGGNQESALREAATLLQSGKTDEAEGIARSVIKDSPQNADAHNLLGVILDGRGQAAEAEREYREALRLNSKAVSARANLGVLLARTNRPDQAIESFEGVLGLVPDHPQATYNLGLLYAARGDYKRAASLLERAAGIGPNAQPHQEKDLRLLLALVNVYLHSGRAKDAALLAQEIEQAAGDDPRVLFTLGLQLAEGNDYERAVRLFERTDRLRPRTAEVLYNLGVALYNLDRLDEAARALESAAALSPADPQPLYRLGLIASARGQSETALGFWQKALTLRERFPEANFMIA